MPQTATIESFWELRTPTRFVKSTWLTGCENGAWMGTIFGTFVAAFIINAIQPGIVAVGLTGYWTQVIYGFIIVVSVSLQAVLRRRLS